MSYFQRLIMNTLTFVALAVLLPNMVHVRSIMMALVASFVLYFKCVDQTNLEYHLISINAVDIWAFQFCHQCFNAEFDFNFCRSC